MKKTIVLTMIIVTTLTISSCSNNAQNNHETTATSTEATIETTDIDSTSESTDVTESLEQGIMDEYLAMSVSEPMEIVKMSNYLKENIDEVTAEKADMMLQVYEKVQMQVLPSYQDAFLEESVQSILLTYSIEDLRQKQVKEEPVLALLTEVVAIGYKVEAIEGTVAPYVDYSYFAEFAAYATEPTASFYKLMKEESDNPSQKDAALLITWEDVLKRGLNFEAYLEAFPDSSYADRARVHLEGYKSLAINGSANVPLFDYDTNEMVSEAKETYIALVDQELDTDFAALIKTFMTLLEAHDFIKTAEVEAFMNTYN